MVCVAAKVIQLSYSLLMYFVFLYSYLRKISMFALQLGADCLIPGGGGYVFSS